MSGPLLLIAIFVLWKYREHVKKAAEAVRKTMKSGSSTNNASDANETGWFRKNLWTILFAIATAIVLFFGVFGSSLKTPSFSEVGGLGHAKWFWVIVLWGLAYGIIAFNAKTLGKATKTLQNILTSVIITLLVLGLFTGQCSGPRTVPAPQANTSVQTSTNIPLVSMPATEWSKLVLSSGGSEQIPVLYGMQIIADGSGADLHTVYADGRDMHVSIESGRSNPDGQIVKVYVKNRLKETNIISFAYSKK